MIFENYPIGQQVEEGHDAADLNIVNFHIEEHTHYDFNVVVIPGEQLTIHFDFNQNEYGQSEAERIRGHFEQLIHQILQQPSVKIEEMELLTQQEKEQLLTPLSGEQRSLNTKRFILCLNARRHKRRKKSQFNTKGRRFLTKS